LNYFSDQESFDGGLQQSELHVRHPGANGVPQAGRNLGRGDLLQRPFPDPDPDRLAVWRRVVL